MTKMTNEEARVLETLAAQLLVAADKRDYTILHKIPSKEVTIVAAKVGVVLGLTDTDTETLVDETNLEEGTMELSVKQGGIYSRVSTQATEDDNGDLTAFVSMRCSRNPIE